MDAMPTPTSWRSRFPAVPSVLIAILTYRRPDDLRAVLPMLQAEASATDAPVRVLVVDNDPDAGAAAVVGGYGDVRYVHEPRPGIAAARNRALAESGDDDVLVFIDDDERPGRGWLSAMLDTHRRHPGPGVVGPVVSSFAVDLDPWVAAGGFFRRRRFPTGSAVHVAATNNLLLDLATVRAAGVRFDERLGLTGGSDTLFTRRLVAAAGPLVWCDEAVVQDVVPPDRCTRRWVLRRQLRSGNSWSRTALMLTGSRTGRIALRGRLVASGTARVVGGAARWFFGLASGRVAERACGARNASRGLGLVLGAFGYSYAEYRRPSVLPVPAGLG